MMNVIRRVSGPHRESTRAPAPRRCDRYWRRRSIRQSPDTRSASRRTGSRSDGRSRDRRRRSSASPSVWLITASLRAALAPPAAAATGRRRARAGIRARAGHDRHRRRLAGRRRLDRRPSMAIGPKSPSIGSAFTAETRGHAGHRGAALRASPSAAARAVDVGIHCASLNSIAKINSRSMLMPRRLIEGGANALHRQARRGQQDDRQRDLRDDQHAAAAHRRRRRRGRLRGEHVRADRDATIIRADASENTTGQMSASIATKASSCSSITICWKTGSGEIDAISCSPAHATGTRQERADRRESTKPSTTNCRSNRPPFARHRGAHRQLARARRGARP